MVSAHKIEWTDGGKGDLSGKNWVEFGNRTPNLSMSVMEKWSSGTMFGDLQYVLNQFDIVNVRKNIIR